MTGTPAWISPEHYRTGTIGSPGDVFARGALLAFTATGCLRRHRRHEVGRRVTRAPFDRTRADNGSLTHPRF
ncbi:serine/threonine protein kinase [Streptomyces sp. SLBN-8D4]